MLFSYNWLKEFVPSIPPPEEVARSLTMSGTEVESSTEVSSHIKNVITAEVLSVDKHPNADRLKLCSVKTSTETLSIVCGASNMKPGDRVALALPGAELSGGVKIKKSKIRGIESAGMMCSEVELGIKDTSEGIMILPGETPLGKDINEVLGLKDSLLEVAVTPNRADLLSVRGLAREISAVTGAPFHEPASFSPEETGAPIEGLIKVRVEEGSPCQRYTARVVTGVNIKASLERIAGRLIAHGIRPINNVVDVTNYVLLETGQPLHAFDLSKIGGSEINVRPAREGETIVTIDGKERALSAGTLVIADSKRAVAIAGVMGGKDSEVTESTKDILIESACFTPSSVRRASRRTGLSTDSSYRFERGVDIEAVLSALNRAAAMIAGLSGGSAAKGAIDAYPIKPKPRQIIFRVKRAGEVVGKPFRTDECMEAFRRLGIKVTGSFMKDGSDILAVIPPSSRGDLNTETDLIEEAARLWGYDAVPAEAPRSSLTASTPGPLFIARKRIGEALRGAGLTEVMNYGFVSPSLVSLAGADPAKGVKILNPLSEEESVMRTSLMPSLLKNLRDNLLKKNDEVRIFEIAPVFLPSPKALPVEEWKAAGLVSGKRWGSSWNLPGEPADFFDAKGAVERVLEALGLEDAAAYRRVTDERTKAFFHPGKSASLYANERLLGHVGEAHPDIMERLDLRTVACLFELDVEALAQESASISLYKGVPKFPESARDIAFIVDDSVTYQEIIGTLRGLDTKLIEKVELFDVYYGRNIPEGKKSLALRVVYRSRERTLKAEEVDTLHSTVSKTLSRNFGAVIRGEGE